MTNKTKKGGSYSRMSRDELLEVCRSLYRKSGIESLSYPFLKKHKSLYSNLYRVGLPQREIISVLGLGDEYKKYQHSIPTKKAGGRLTHRWTWERCVGEARSVKDQLSYLPPAAWFQANGHGSLIQAVYNLGKTWGDLREELGDFSTSTFVESRSGDRWRSHAEASLSNYLYARGIEHKRGERYPEDYANHSTAKYAYYDLHFRALSGGWINVEVWGDKPNGHEEERYREKRAHKEGYHARRIDFLGIHFSECYSDNALTRILEPYIGSIEAFRFDKATDRKIESSHWSNADELLASCRALAASMPDGTFPTEGWLRKRGQWRNRAGEPLNTMSIYIKQWLGGVRKVRELLGQEHNSTKEWSRESAISAYKAFYEEHGMTADQYRHRFKAGNDSATKDVAKYAANIAAAVLQYAGGSASVNELLGITIDRTRRWTRKAIIAGYREVADKWGVSPSQLLSDYRASKIELDPEYAAELQRLIGATGSQFPGGSRDVYDAISFEPPSRPRRTRARRTLQERVAPNADTPTE